MQDSKTTMFVGKWRSVAATVVAPVDAGILLASLPNEKRKAMYFRVIGLNLKYAPFAE